MGDGQLTLMNGQVHGNYWGNKLLPSKARQFPQTSPSVSNRTHNFGQQTTRFDTPQLIFLYTDESHGDSLSAKLLPSCLLPL